MHDKKNSIHSSSLNDSKISVDSDAGIAIQERPAFTLRVINPDFYEEDNEPALQPYKPTLVANSVASTPELRRATVQQKAQSTTVITTPPSVDAWQGEDSSNHGYSFSDVTTPSSPRSPQQQPTVSRKASKILVEPTNMKNDLELLPPLQTLPPLFSLDESHLLSPSTPTSETVVTMTTSSHTSELSPTTLTQISPLEAITKKSNKPPLPILPQHSSDYFFKSSPTTATQKEMVNTTMVKPPPPEETIPTVESTLNYIQPSDRQLEPIQQDRPIPPTTLHTRSPSVTPSMSASIKNSTNPMVQQQQHTPPPPQLSSRYSKASYSLTNHPDAIKLYRSMAMKTGDPTVQLTYAKYLLEVATLYDAKDKRQHFKPNLSLSLPLLKKPHGLNGRPSSIASSRRSSMDTHISINTFSRRDSSVSMMQPAIDDEEVSKKKKKKMLQEEGVRWIKKLARQQVGEAAYLLGLWYDRGMYGFRKNSTKAIKFYEIAANEKVPEAMFAMGQYHEREQDYMTSFKLYEEAASLGLVEALYVSFLLW